VIESKVESSCLPSHIDEINLFLKKEAKCAEDLQTKIILLFKKPQKFFGVEKMSWSKDKWINAVAELLKFPEKILPSEKLKCLQDTVMQIHQKAKRVCREQITTDDLLSIVIFVLVKASHEAQRAIITAADVLFVKSLIDAEALNDERVYYLCVISVTLEFVRNYDSHKIEQKLNGFINLNEWGFGDLPDVLAGKAHVIHCGMRCRGGGGDDVGPGIKRFSRREKID